MPNVLSIGCDPESLEDRHILLREAGVFVTSVLGYAELKDLRLPVCFDVVLIGDDWPIYEVESLVNWAHNNAPTAMVVVLQRNGTTRSCEKCYYANADDPQDWLRLWEVNRSPSCSDAGRVDDVRRGGGTSGTVSIAPPVNVPPTEFTDQMEALENWANTNNKEAIADLIEYWALKLPAIVVAVSSAVLAHFKLDNLAVVAAAIAAACVLIDGLNPRGALRKVHQRAYNEISMLHANMAAQWRTGLLGREHAEQLAAEIIEGSEAERNRISAYLTAAKIALSDRRIDVGIKPW